MNIDVKIRLKNEKNKVLCFKHAVQAAIKGEDIDTEIDDFGGDYDMRSTLCSECYPGYDD